MFERLETLQLIVVTGKGGVGKSAVAAAVAFRLAARGRRVLLYEVDPRESLHQLLDVPPSGGRRVEVEPRLALVHVDPRGLIDDVVRERLKVGVLVRRVLSSPVHQHFTEGAPGLKETAVFGSILRLVDGHGPRGAPPPDVVVLDAPASGHGVSWLAAPRLISEVIRSGPVGRMATDIAEFMARTDRFGVLAVTTAEEMPVQECLELAANLAAGLDRRPEAIVVNGLYPPAPRRRARRSATAALWARRRDINERELERLRRGWTGPTLELPLLPIDPGPELVGALGHRLEAAARAGS